MSRTIRIYDAKLKSRREIDKTIPRERQGWWADVCPGQRLILRDATEADLARCFLRGGPSPDPSDYLCELPADGALVSRLAIDRMRIVDVPVVEPAPPQPVEKFCYGRCEERFTGECDSREDAAAEALQDLEADALPGDEVTFWTAKVRPAWSFFPGWERSLGRHIQEQVDEWLAEEIAADDAIVELAPERAAELGRLALDFLRKHAEFRSYAIDDVQRHSQTMPGDQP
jgi:hypothetical protein